MSGELDIHHGGAISVDTEAMRDVGRRAADLADQYEVIRGTIDRVHRAVVGAPRLIEAVDEHALRSIAERVTVLGADAQRAATGTLLMADAFEVIELRAQAEALAHTDGAAAAAAEAQLERMLDSDPRLEPMADWLVARWKKERFEGLGDQWDMGGVLPPIFLVGAMAGVMTGLGTIAAGDRLRGRADPVRVTAVATTRPAGAPTGAVDVLKRMPSTAGAQIAVEKLTMPDGRVRFVAYVLGTQKPAPWQAGGSDPWDMKSNAELYTGQRSASYQAVLDALADAGAEAGDQVDVVGHSHGAMIAGRLAMESEFEVTQLITVGSPTEPALDEDQTLAQLGHSDDVVRGLAAGGSVAGTGSADSFTATRVGDPAETAHDLALKTHSLESYEQTAAMIDASDDPRAEVLREYFVELDTAVSVERTEYRAERIGE